MDSFGECLSCGNEVSQKELRWNGECNICNQGYDIYQIANLIIYSCSIKCEHHTQTCQGSSLRCSDFGCAYIPPARTSNLDTLG